MANILQYIYENFPNSEKKNVKMFSFAIVNIPMDRWRIDWSFKQDVCNLFHKPYFWLCSSCVVHVYETINQIGLNLFDLLISNMLQLRFVY